MRGTLGHTDVQEAATASAVLGIACKVSISGGDRSALGTPVLVFSIRPGLGYSIKSL